MIDILIPTIKKMHDLGSLIDEINKYTVSKFWITASSEDQSAAKNRNWVFNETRGKYCIMIDDDVTGFYSGWEKDMLSGLDRYKLISARLIKKGGAYNTMIDYGYRLRTSGAVPVKYVPAACIAFRRETLNEIKKSKMFPHNTPFDENYQRACFEDTDICECINKIFLEGHIVVTNDCKIVHLNEEKWRPGFDWTENQKYFERKWHA